MFSWPRLLIALFVFIPAIVGLKVVELDNHEFGQWLNSETLIDLFSYYKAKTLIGISTISLLLFIGFQSNRLLIKNSYQKHRPLFFFLILYLSIIVASSCLSTYGETSWWGVPDRYEGALVWISYLLFFVMTISVITTEQSYQLIEKCLMALISFEFIVGLLQLVDIDFWQNHTILSLLSFGQPFENIKKLDFLQNEFKVYGTLYHYNFFGSFLSLIVPYLLHKALIFPKKKYFIFFTCGLFLTFVCGSRAGMVGVSASLLFFVLINFRIRQFSYKSLARIFVPSSLIVILLGCLHTPTRNRWGTFLHLKQNLTSNESTAFQKIELMKEKALIQFGHKAFYIKAIDNNFIFFDASSERILHRFDPKTGQVHFNSNYLEELQFYFLAYKNKKILALHNGKIKLGFIIDQGEIAIFDLARKATIKSLYTSTGKIEIPFAFASGRGYIWSRTLDLISLAPWLGLGADTFIYYFPVNDVIGRFQTYGDTLTYVDKPHSFYLQQLVSFGLLGFLALMLIISYSVFKNRSSLWLYSILGYLVTAIFNDSLISVTPLFWLILGLNFSNYSKSQSKSL